MTFTITKAKLGIAILAMALLVPATAWATHSFDDVADGAFYHDASAWAKTNGITVGSGNCGGTGNNFCGELGVTRGENITFAHRYDTNIVQPALATIPTVVWAKVNSDGTLADGSAGVTSVKNGTGSYTVDFGIDVQACSWSGVIRNNASAFIIIGNTVDKFVTLTQGSSGFLFTFAVEPTEIDVSSRDNLTTTGAAIDGPFNLQVTCP